MQTATSGLGKYEAVFRETEIGDAVLLSLTHENRKELGVARLGPFSSPQLRGAFTGFLRLASRASLHAELVDRRRSAARLGD